VADFISKFSFDKMKKSIFSAAFAYYLSSHSSEIALEPSPAVDKALDRGTVTLIQSGLANILVHSHVAELSGVGIHDDEATFDRRVSTLTGRRLLRDHH